MKSVLILPLILSVSSCAHHANNPQTPLILPAPSMEAPDGGQIIPGQAAREPASVSGATAIHNELRAREQAGLPVLQWDATVAAYAQQKVSFLAEQNNCQLDHHVGPKRPGYGENLAWASYPNYTVRAAVEAWYSEKPHYQYSDNSCNSGEVCGHYTQVVWRDSTALGCAAAVCPNGGDIIYGCNYNPPGNWVGEKPY